MARLPRRIVRCAILTVLLAAAAAPASDAAAADAAAVATERYYSSYAEAPSPAQLTQERYYSSYGEPESLSPATTGNGEDVWPLIVLGVAAVAAATCRHVLRRRRRTVRA